MSTIEFQSVSGSYGSNVVFSDLSFQIKSGDRVVIHGPSGCGKTTVLRLIAGFVVPVAGSIRIDDRIVAEDGRLVIKPQHRRLGMVFQDLALWPHLTVYQNLEFALKAENIKAATRRERIELMLTRVRLEGVENSYPGKLSGGQQQRVAVARALVAEPLALLMDEPLSNLDDELKEDLCNQILELHAQLGFTLVYVTHSKEEMRRMGAKLIHLRDGKEVTV